MWYTYDNIHVSVFVLDGGTRRVQTRSAVFGRVGEKIECNRDTYRCLANIVLYDSASARTFVNNIEILISKGNPKQI